MKRLEEVLRKAVEILTQSKTDFALVGGLAVSARSEPRFTHDVDLVVSVAGDQEAESLIHAFQQRGFRLFALVEQEAVGRLATARLLPPGEDETGVVLDLLFASSGIERELSADAEPLAIFPSVVVPVATAGFLFAMKLLSQSDSRRQDLVDLQALRAVLTPEELRRAETAVGLMEERGFNRGRDLQAALKREIPTKPKAD